MYNCIKKKKMLRNKLNQGEQLYSGNYKILTKESENNQNKWKNILSYWIRSINIIKMSILPPSNLQIQCHTFQNTNGIFHGIERKNSEFCIENRLWTEKEILRKKKKAEFSCSLISNYTTKL